MHTVCIFKLKITKNKMVHCLTLHISEFKKEFISKSVRSVKIVSVQVTK